MIPNCMPLLAALKPTYAVVMGVAIITLHLLAVIAVLAGRGSTAHKLTWSLAIVLLPVAGVLLYFAYGKSEADRPLLD